MGKNVAIICTSADKLGDAHATGLWLEECAAPYYVLKGAGHNVDIISVKGGAIPVDAGSIKGDFYTAVCKKFKEEDADAWKAFQESKKLDPVTITAYDGIFFAGGHGTVVDFVNAEVTQSVEAFFATGKPLAAVCHGPVCLCQAKTADGASIVKGKKVTGFSQAEEDMVQLSGLVPFVPETKLIELGGIYEKADGAFHPKAVRDGNLITGQNPSSSEATATLLVEALA